ncbi:MAG: glycosyltransferase family A protein [Tissierellia bacterium]|nr:glycosyltransferase family A protein [Tissierellia bacterium]
MKSTLISVIVPCYNQSRYIKQTISSLLSQTYHNWECLIIDDGSTDKTKEIVQILCKKDNRLNYIYQENQGVSVARNNAIKKSIGDYILCLDGDDCISDNFLEEMVKVLDEKSYIKVVTSTVKLFGKRNKILYLPEYSLEALMGRNLFVMTSMFRREDFDKCGGFNDNMRKGLEDWDFWLSILENGGEVQKVEDVTFYYRIKKRSRNKDITSESYDVLRRNIYENHKELYSKYFFNPKHSFEYTVIADSLEYKIGKLLLKPLRFIYG